MEILNFNEQKESGAEYGETADVFSRVRDHQKDVHTEVDDICRNNPQMRVWRHKRGEGRKEDSRYANIKPHYPGGTEKKKYSTPRPSQSPRRRVGK